MVRGRKRASPGWRVFLKNHAREITAIDFSTVATVNFRILIRFVVLNQRFTSRTCGSWWFWSRGCCGHNGRDGMGWALGRGSAGPRAAERRLEQRDA